MIYGVFEGMEVEGHLAVSVEHKTLITELWD